MSYGFPTFPCSEACGKNVGVKGTKCKKCKDKAQFGKLKEAVPPEVQAARYVERMDASRATRSRRAGRSV